jgi:hypothetical protein
MKRTLLTMGVCMVMISTAAVAGRGSHNHGYRSGGVNDSSAIIETTAIDSETAENLVFMYQEEKVARDTYEKMYELWKNRVFSRIASSEQRHMDAIEKLLVSHSIPVPVIEDTRGVFENEELQALYDDLIEQGSISLEEALRVGVVVEETDIADLEERIVNAPADVQRVFSNLLRGSNNHLRAFERVLERVESGSLDSSNSGRANHKNHNGKQNGRKGR